MAKFNFFLKFKMFELRLVSYSSTGHADSLSGVCLCGLMLKAPQHAAYDDIY